MKNKISILYDFQIMSQQKFGGISRYFFEIISRIEKMEEYSITVPLLCGNNYYFRNYYLFKQLGNITTKRMGVNYVLNKLFSLLSMRKKYDIIHPTFYDPYIINKVSGKLIVTIHDMIPEIMQDELAFSKEEIENKKKYIEAADRIITVSEWTKKDLLQIYPYIDAEKIDVIYHGNSMVISEEMPTLVFPQNYILFVGNREYYKNFMFFIENVTEILGKHQDLEILCAGGSDFSELEIKKFKELGIESRVRRFLMSDIDLQWAYRKAKCFVFPSLYEGFGIPILEAWTCKCPIVLADASCFKEIAGDAALYFEPGNGEEMKEKIKSLLIDTSLCNDICSRGLERVKQFSWSNAAEKTFQVYRKSLTED